MEMVHEKTKRYKELMARAIWRDTTVQNIVNKTIQAVAMALYNSCVSWLIQHWPPAPPEETGPSSWNVGVQAAN